jgi:hypothetical protein
VPPTVSVPVETAAAALVRDASVPVSNENVPVTPPVLLTVRTPTTIVDARTSIAWPFRLTFDVGVPEVLELELATVIAARPVPAVLWIVSVPVAEAKFTVALDLFAPKLIVLALMTFVPAPKPSVLLPPFVPDPTARLSVPVVIVLLVLASVSVALDRFPAPTVSEPVGAF